MVLESVLLAYIGESNEVGDKKKYRELKLFPNRENKAVLPTIVRKAFWNCNRKTSESNREKIYSLRKGSDNPGSGGKKKCINLKCYLNSAGQE